MEFLATVLDENAGTLVIHIAALLTLAMQVHTFDQVQIRLLLANKAPIKVLPKYLNYVDIFLFDLVMKLYENTDINEHAIKLVEITQLPYKLIYSLRLVELGTLKTYIEIHLETRFIQLSKSLTNALIFFD